MNRIESLPSRDHHDATDAPLLSVTDLTVEYHRSHGRPPIRAVDGVSFTLESGETVGLVGESGSGKSTIGRAILGLAPISQGSIVFRGEDVTYASHRRRRALSAEMQVVFQDPYSSLNPTRTVGQTLLETLRVHKRDVGRRELEAQVAAMLAQVGLDPDAGSRYPGHFSGGQRQRVAIARALIAHPRLVVCDEPTSALDLSIQAQILNLLADLQQELKFSYIFISHDLTVTRHTSHRILVLYQGRIMELGDAERLYTRPQHPYTQALLASAPLPDPAEQRRRRVRTRAAEAAVVSRSGDSCPFASRCPYVIEICRMVRPELEPTPAGGVVACHRWTELDSGSSMGSAQQ